MLSRISLGRSVVKYINNVSWGVLRNRYCDKIDALVCIKHIADEAISLRQVALI